MSRERDLRATNTLQEETGSRGRKGTKRDGSKGRPTLTVAPHEEEREGGRLRSREQSQGSLTPSPGSKKNEERRGSPPGSFDGGGGKKKGKKESLFGITKSDESKRSAVSSLDTSTQGGSSSSRTRVVPSVVLSGTVDKGPKNREISESPKGGSFSFGKKSQGVSIHDSVKEVLRPMLEQLMERRLKGGFIFNRDGVPQEGETAARQTERE